MLFPGVLTAQLVAVKVRQRLVERRRRRLFQLDQLGQKYGRNGAPPSCTVSAAAARKARGVIGFRAELLGRVAYGYAEADFTDCLPVG